MSKAAAFPKLVAGLAALGAMLAATAAAPAAIGGGASSTASADGLGFKLIAHRIAPKRPLFDGEKRIRLSYRVAGQAGIELRITVIEVKTGRVVAAWRTRAADAGELRRRSWDGLDRRGEAVADGRYEFRVGPLGERDRYAGRLRIHGHVFPVDGPHAGRGAVGEFGAGRNGGRVHEGFDIVADCGTGLRAARGGRVKEVGYDPVLYGHFVRIAGRKLDEQYFYSHLLSAPSVREGGRVQTGQRLGQVGQTGNAQSTPCHLHFELWVDGRPVDPGPELDRWDQWS